MEYFGASPSGKASDSDSDISGVRIPVPQPSLTNLNLLFTVGGLVRLFLCISEMNPDFLAFRRHQFSTVLESVNVKNYR